MTLEWRLVKEWGEGLEPPDASRSPTNSHPFYTDKNKFLVFDVRNEAGSVQGTHEGLISQRRFRVSDASIAHGFQELDRKTGIFPELSGFGALTCIAWGLAGVRHLLLKNECTYRPTTARALL